MLKGYIFTFFAFLCCAMYADNIEMGKKAYHDVVISGASKDKIWFLQTGRVNTSRSMDEVKRLTIEAYPEFNKAEDLLAQGKYAKAMKQYLEAYKSVNDIKAVWRKKSLEHLDNQKKISEAYEANAKSDWIKELIKLRYARAKGLQSGEIDADGPDEKASDSGDDTKFCPECRGKGKIKCPRCNGSGKQKCSHMVDGVKHSDYYEICSKCNGKGYELEHYTEEVWVRDPHRSAYHNYGHYETRQKTRKVPCSNKGCKPFKLSPNKTVYVTWVCPYCANSRYVGYTDCPYCEKGRIECQKCNGTGKIATGPKKAAESTATVAAPAPKDELESPKAMLNVLEKAVGDKLAKSPYNTYIENELKRQKEKELFDQTIAPFIIAAQKYNGRGVKWQGTVERVSKVQRDSFIITTTFVRDNDNADIWTLRAIVPSKFSELGENLSTNSMVEVTGKISGVDFKTETITLIADHIKTD